MMVLIYNNQITFDLIFSYPFPVSFNIDKETLVYEDEVIIPFHGLAFNILKSDKDKIKSLTQNKNFSKFEPVAVAVNVDKEIFIYGHTEDSQIIKVLLPPNCNTLICTTTASPEVIFRNNLNKYISNPNINIKDVLLDIYSKTSYAPKYENGHITNLDDLANQNLSKIEKLSLFENQIVIEHTLETLEEI